MKDILFVGKAQHSAVLKGFVTRCRVTGRGASDDLLGASAPSNETEDPAVVDLGALTWGRRIDGDGQGRLVVVGARYSTPWAWANIVVVRLRTDGTLDPAFAQVGWTEIDFSSGGTQTEDIGTAVAVDSAGRVVVVGDTRSAGVANRGVARFTDAGVLDTQFASGGKAVVGCDYWFNPTDEWTTTVDLLPDGRIQIGAATTWHQPTPNREGVCLVRLQAW